MTAPAAGTPGLDAPEPSAKPARRMRSPRALAQLTPWLRPYRGALIFASVCLVGSVAIMLAFPAIVNSLLDAAFQRHDSGLLDRVALLLVALFAVQGVLNFAQVYVLSSTAERVTAALRDRVFAHLVNLSPGFFTDQRSGDLTSRLSADLAVLQSVLNNQAAEIARQVLFLVGGLALLTLTHTQLMLTTLAVVPVIVGSAVLFGRRLRRASTGVQDRIARAMGMAQEAFGQIRTVQSFNREGVEASRYAGLMREVVLAAIRRARIRAMLFGVVGFVAFAGVTAVLWEGGRMVLANQLTAGSLVAFLLYAIFVAAAVGSLASLFGSYQEAIGAAQRVFEILETKPTVPEPAAPAALAKPVRGEVVLDRVFFRYADDLPYVLHDVSLRIAPGEVVALVGPSGAGKTTVASLLPRFWDVTSGAITVDGVNVRDLSFSDLRGAIGMVPQEPALFSGTVRENIAYARPGESAHPASDEDVHAAARAAHALEFIERLPQGFDTLVGERGVKLSGGQRQRIAIARVFLKNPAIVVLDEATSSLDSESERLVEEAMGDLLRNRSTLIIAHRLSTVRRANRVIALEKGRVVEAGAHDELLARDGLFARLYRTQFAGAEQSE
ncbi:MAG TPA: ABC transporter transmembrane domain-containing protein [Gemmatimonadaceae bacterium]|nr:ABC transporter transmembrane domain-containing protein [Gemmatimonadaceae bacterium]